MQVEKNLNKGRSIGHRWKITRPVVQVKILKWDDCSVHG